MLNKKSKQNTGHYVLFLAVALVALLAFAGCSANKKVPEAAEPAASTQAAAQGDAEDLVIPVADLTGKPQFFAYNAEGNDMEIIALTASDGSIRTAFNTCQVCYSSGKGYYKVEGNGLVCQNCGNTFGFDDISVTRGGCNPVPISEKDRPEQDGNLVISAGYLSDASQLFENWK